MTRPVVLNGVDCSYDGLTRDEALRLRGIGVLYFQQCLWTGNERPSVAINNLRVARDAGFGLLGYASITPSKTGDWHMGKGREGVPDDLWTALIRDPVDVELPNLTVVQVVDALNAQVGYGKRPDVYTSYNAWVNLLTPSNPILADQGVGLQNAYWDDHPDFDFPSLMYGGWMPEQVWGEQWSGGTYVEGQFVDRNTFWFPTTPPQPAERTPRDYSFAGSAFSTFVAIGDDPKTKMHPFDKETLRIMWEKVQ